MKSLLSKFHHSDLSKAIILVLVFSFFLNLNAKIKVTDATTGLPLPKASVFDKNGVFIAVTEDDGTIPENISISSYPLNIRYVGYIPIIVKSPDFGVVTMEETSYTLPDIVIDEVSRNILYLQAYVREYTTIENSKDTMATFTEQIVDYAIPVGKAKFRGWKKPRVLAQQKYEYLKIDKKKTSLDTLLISTGGKFKSTNFKITQKFKVPESILSGDSTEYIKYGKHYLKERWSVVGNNYIYETDNLADYKDHSSQPGFLKLFGLSAEMSMDEQKYMFEKENQGEANVENLIEASETFNLIMKGKMIKKATEQNDDTKMSVLTEMFVIDRRYLTSEEATELKKDTPVIDIVNFKIPEGIPAPPEEVVKLKDAALNSVFLFIK